MNPACIYVPSEEDGSTWTPRYPPRRPLPTRLEALEKAAEKEQRKALGSAKAEAILPAPLLKKKLGASTYRLWCALLTMRDDTAMLHPLVSSMARAAHLGVHQAEKSLARLRQFKLLEDFGDMYRHVPCKCPKEVGWHEHKVYVRYVYGQLRAPVEANGDMTALVPRATVPLVKEAAGQGGKRAGAGRPKGKLDSEPRRLIKGGVRKSNVGTYKYQELASYEEPSVLQRSAKFHFAAQSTTQEAGVNTPANPSEGSTGPSIQPKASAEVALMPKTVQPKAQPAGSAPKNQAVTAEAPPLCVADDGLDAEWTAIFGEEGAAEIGLRSTPVRRQRYTSEDLRVSTELIEQVTYLRAPAPPKVHETHTDEERLALLAAAYRAAHSKVMRREFWRPRKPQSVAERKAMLEASHALTAEGISPHAWAMFSCYRWGAMGKSGSPSIKWVWNAVRIHEQASWCHEQTGTQATSRPWPSPSMGEFVKRVGLIRSLLGYGRPTDEVVSQILPDEERKVLLARAQREREVGQQDMMQAIKAGEWVW